MISMELDQNKSEKVNYDYCGYPFYIRKGFLSNYANYAALNHWHDAIELIAVINGEMDYNVNGQILNLPPGSGIIINSGQMHYGFSDQKTECEYLCILLHPVALCSVPSFEQDFIQPITRSIQNPFFYLSPDCSWQKQIYDRIVSIYENRNKTSAPLWILSDFSAIWALLYENMPAEDQTKQRQNHDLVTMKQMVDFIQKNYAEKITLSEIARSGSVGKSKCCRLFYKFFSQSPNVYLNQYRINKSIELLKNTDMTMIEIAFSVGFGSASYYSETFRKWTKKSPTDFRKNL